MAIHPGETHAILGPARIAIGIALVERRQLLRCSLSSRPSTIAQALKRHNIEISTASLLEALHNPDNGARGLAAAG